MRRCDEAWETGQKRDGGESGLISQSRDRRLGAWDRFRSERRTHGQCHRPGVVNRLGGGGLSLGVGAGGGMRVVLGVDRHVVFGGVGGVAARVGGEGHFVDPVERKGGGFEGGAQPNSVRTALQGRMCNFA